MTTTIRGEMEEKVAHQTAGERVAASNAASERFFGDESSNIARACQAMAARFQRGGRLLVCGEGAQRSDVAHVIVEFVHPVVVGKRALPALALSTSSNGGAESLLETIGRPEDIVLCLDAGAPGPATWVVLAAAHRRGMLTIALVGESSGPPVAASHLFTVPSHDPCIVQETHELLYHVLWELVHVFLEHRAVRA